MRNIYARLNALLRYERGFTSGWSKGERSAARVGVHRHALSIRDPDKCRRCINAPCRVAPTRAERKERRDGERARTEKDRGSRGILIFTTWYRILAENSGTGFAAPTDLRSLAQDIPSFLHYRDNRDHLLILENIVEMIDNLYLAFNSLIIFYFSFIAIGKD